ncbi:hypothetical protein [Photorhabdus heterorhabditis]|uniref:hypothetical protein n=1 Tax=Photorhabdus heterorhabditis TaxID=880156 RepID=UPI001C2668C8|nr:hypothetical protein [Photorhabdus heterorhabditis]
MNWKLYFNYGLVETKFLPETGEKFPSVFELNRRVTQWKKRAEMAGHTQIISGKS